MKLFRDYVMAWWQVGLLKAYVFVIGLMIGSYFSDAVGQYMKLWWIIVIVLAIYFLYKLFTGGFAARDSNA